MKQNYKFMLSIILLLAITFLPLANPVAVKAEINVETSEEMTSRTAYLDLSSVSPLQLHFAEDNTEKKPDYYYAAMAFSILKERIQMDSMYRNCKEVIVTVNQAYSSNEAIQTSMEPKAQTGYLNLLSKETNKCYTIDKVIIHIQREDQK